MKKFLSILILAVFAATIAILVYSVAFGQDMMLEAVIEDDKIVVSKITKTKLETTLLPNTELGISIEDAKKVCLASTGRIATTEETNKKINFWTFPLMATKTIITKEVSYNQEKGWQNVIVNKKPVQEKKWGLNFILVALLAHLLYLSWLAWRKYENLLKTKPIYNLIKIYVCIFTACCATVFATIFISFGNELPASSIIAHLIIALFFVVTAGVVIIMLFAAFKYIFKNSPTHMIVHSFAFLFFIIIASMATNYNSAEEFLGLLAGMMALSFVAGWLIHLVRKKNRLAREAAEAAVRNTAPIRGSQRK